MYTKQELTDKTEGFWTGFNELVKSIPTLEEIRNFRKFVIESEDPLKVEYIQCKTNFLDTIIEETLKRTKKELYDETMLSYSDPVAFTMKLLKTYHKHESDILREAKEGKIELDDVGKKVFEKLDIDSFVTDLTNTYNNNLNSEFLFEKAFLEAGEKGDYERARRILDGLKATYNWEIGDKLTQETIQLLNWEIDLAAVRGDVDKYLSLFNTSKSIEKTGIATMYEPILQGTLENLIPKAYGNKIAIVLPPNLIEDQVKEINKMFNNSFFPKLAGTLILEAEISTREKFDDIVKKTAIEAGRAISQSYPDIDIKINYQGGK